MSSRRPRYPSRGALAALVAASALLHAGAVGVAIGLGGASSRAPAPGQARDVAADEPLCPVTAALAAAARAGRCAVPIAGLGGRCERGPLRALELDLVQCAGLSGPEPFLEPGETEVALMDPESIPEVEEIPPPPVDRSGQIVEITEPEDARRPEQARYLSEFDSTAERETVARGTTETMVSRPRPESSEAERRARQRRRQEPNSEPPGERELAMREPGSDRAGAEGGLEGLRRGGEIPAAGGPRAREGGAGTGDGPQVDLRPTEELLARALEGSGGSVDHLRGVQRGERTALNSVQFKHASFFNRVKREVAQRWSPGEVIRRHDPEGDVVALRDRVTVVRVWLTPDGSLARIVVARESGVDVLDDEALSAFRAAQPFPNPPGELVAEGSGLVRFEFGFHVQTGGGRWRIFRNR